MNRFNPLKRSIALCAAILGLFATVIVIAPSAAPAQGISFDLQGWFVEEFQPRIRPGGRANTIAVRPDDGLILVASESGGLFRSTDGNKWEHVDSLPVFYTNAVAFAKDNVVIVTASEDFSVSNRGGIWRSPDEGKTWTQVPFPPGGTGKRLSAYEISVAPDTGTIYVATNYGVWMSDDPKGETWSKPPVDPFADPVDPPEDRRIISVLALPKTAEGKNLVLAGGPAGIRRSIDGGTSWLKPTPPFPNIGLTPDTIEDMHAFARSPAANNQAYVVAPAALDDTGQKLLGLSQNGFNAACKSAKCGYMVLYLTTTGGDTWEQKSIAPLNSWRPAAGGGYGGCGGIGFVKAIGTSTSFDLYVSSRCYVWRLPAGGAKLEPFIVDIGSKLSPTSEVGDTRDLAFNAKNAPILVASDNGLAKPPTGTSTIWTLAGDEGFAKGNGPNGYNALQIYEVKGQWIGSRHDLYFGTQDNNLWSSSDWGVTWKRCCNEGGYIEAQYRVPSESDSQITFVPGGDNRKLPELIFTGASNDTGWPPGGGLDWDLHDCDTCGHPKIISKNFHVQGVNRVLGEWLPTVPPVPKVIWSKGLARSTDFGKTWQQYAKFDDDRRDLPKFSAPTLTKPEPRQKTGPVLYQAIRIGGWDNKKTEKIQLARIVKKPLDSLASVTTPANTINYMTGFGGIGQGPTMNSDYRVFDVDPGDKNHVIAADVFKEKMMETTDGGYKWTEMPLLTSLVTDGGKLYFCGRNFFSQYPALWYAPASPVTQASAISFCPDNPNVVAVGTVQNGIFISADHGKDGTWKEAHGSKRATLISSLHWRKPDDLIVSTYGRGLWRVKFKYLINLPGLPCNPPDCITKDYERRTQPQPSAYDEVLVAVAGSIEGARITNGIVREVYVRPATTVAFGTDLEQVPHIKVTETTKPVRFQGIRSVPRPPAEARIITGLTLKKTGETSKLVGFQFSRRPRSMYTPEERPAAEERPVVPEQPPTEQKPYLEVLSTSVGPGSTIQLSGRGLSPGGKIEIAVDGNTVQKLAANREGKFSSAVEAPTQFGSHSLTLIDSVSGKILDGVMVSVRPIDRPRSR